MTHAAEMRDGAGFMKINNITLQVSQIVALVSAVGVGASRLTSIEGKADQAQKRVEQLTAELSDVRKAMAEHREILATVQGDARAILQLIKLRGNQ